MLRVLINILDPNDQAHTDSTRLTALRILNVALEASGPRIGSFPSLTTLVVDYGCKYLFQLARSDTPTVLQTTLRTISTMFETMRPRLKLQQELFLAFTIDRLAPPPMPSRPQFGLGFRGSPRPGTPILGTPKIGPAISDLDQDKGPATPRVLVAPARGDTRELFLETLSLISRQPSFMVDLYSNYDCDMNCENMFEKLIDFAAKVHCSNDRSMLAVHSSLTHSQGVYPLQTGPSQEYGPQNSQYLCLDLILAFVNHLAARAEGVGNIYF